MHAVAGVVKVDTSREDEARQLLKDFVVPTASALAGFQSGTWTRAVDADTGHSLLLFDSEENARAGAAAMSQGPPPGAPVTVVSVTVCEVLTQA